MSTHALKGEILYTDTLCPVCKLIEEYLDEKKIEYTKVNVDEDPEGKEAFLKLGYDNLPVLEIAGTTILGYNTEEIERVLKEKRLPQK